MSFLVLRRRWALVVALGMGAWPFAGARGDAGAAISIWNEIALRAIGYGKASPLESSRHLAMIQLAVWRAVEEEAAATAATAAANEGWPEESRLGAATLGAAYHSLRLLFPTSADMLDSHYRVGLAMLPAGGVTSNAVERGRQAARQVLRERDGDGSGVSVRFEERREPGYWLRTPPGWDRPLLPGWGRVRPFALPSPDSVRPPPFPRLESAAWAEEYNEVKRLGATNSTVRSPMQREIARFWADGPGTETPPGHWNRVAQHLIREQQLDPRATARLFAVLNVAMADAGIAVWEAKYAEPRWRPVTAIRAADTDGNPATEPDPTWTPLIPTPPFPEYVSGHSGFSAAAATVLARFHGGDDFEFVLTSEGLRGVSRRYRAFSEAAREAGWSRIYGGIHFRSGCEAGFELGRQVAEAALARFASPGGTRP